MGKWKTGRLGDVSEIVFGQSPPGSTYNVDGDGLPFFQGKAEFGDLYPTPAKWCSAPAKIATEGDILISVRAPVGPTNVAPFRCCIGRGLAAIRPVNGLVERDFILHYLRRIEPEISRRGQGTTFGAIGRKELAELPVPLPPLSKQRQIVDILNRANGILRLRRSVREHIARLSVATFARAFGEHATGRQHWAVVPLSEVGSIFSGVTKGRRLDANDMVQLPYLRVANVQDGTLDLSEIKTITVRRSEIERYSLEIGDLLMTEGGDADKLGRAALWTGAIRPCLHQNHLFRVRCHKSRLHPVYLRALVGSPYGKRYFLRVAKRTTGIASINKTQLSGFPVILPPLPLQLAFARQVAELEDLAVQTDRAALAADALRASLMMRLLGG